MFNENINDLLKRTIIVYFFIGSKYLTDIQWTQKTNTQKVNL